jgi:hypothetical protein
LPSTSGPTSPPIATSSPSACPARWADRCGSIASSYGRGLGIAVRDLAIAEDPRFGDGDFVTTHGAFVQVRILPALFGRYEVARISLESPAISLVKTADGVNLGTLSTGENDSGDTSSARSRAIAVALLDIENATVRYGDRTQKPAHEIEVSRLDFQASDLSFGDAVRFELSAAVLGAPSPNVTASGAVGPVDPADVAATPLDLVFQLDGVDGSALQAVLPAGAELRLEGPLTAKLEVGGTVAAWSLNFLLNLGRSRVAYGRVVDKARNVDLTVSGHLERRPDDSIVAEGVEIATTSSKLTLGATVAPREKTTAYAIELDATGVSLADLASLSPALRDTGVEGHADVALDVAKPLGATAPSIDGRIGLDGIGARLSEGTAEISQLSGILAFKGKSATLAPADLRVGGAPARFAARVEASSRRWSRSISSAALPLAAVMADAGDDVLRESPRPASLAHETHPRARGRRACRRRHDPRGGDEELASAGRSCGKRHPHRSALFRKLRRKPPRLAPSRRGRGCFGFSASRARRRRGARKHRRAHRCPDRNRRWRAGNRRPRV